MPFHLQVTIGDCLAKLQPEGFHEKMCRDFHQKAKENDNLSSNLRLGRFNQV